MIITNNPLVRDIYSKNGSHMGFGVEICYLAVEVLNLLEKVRDLIYEGYPLLSHPLPASIRIIYSPYRSVMIGAVSGKLDPWHAEMAEESVRKYRQTMGYRTPDNTNAEDYAWMDEQLLSTALKESRPLA